MRLVTAPEYILNPEIGSRSLFLAGSIEMGKAEEWQDKVVQRLKESPSPLFSTSQLIVYNPRRNEWDATWKQGIDYPQFNQQVNWEMDALEKADYILFYFAPETMSPISLLELGKYGTKKRVYVTCPSDYQRSGNVEIFCYRYNIPLFRTLNEAILRFAQDYSFNR